MANDAPETAIILPKAAYGTATGSNIGSTRRSFTTGNANLRLLKSVWFKYTPTWPVNFALGPDGKTSTNGRCFKTMLTTWGSDYPCFITVLDSSYTTIANASSTPGDGGQTRLSVRLNSGALIDYVYYIIVDAAFSFITRASPGAESRVPDGSVRLTWQEDTSESLGSRFNFSSFQPERNSIPADVSNPSGQVEVVEVGRCNVTDFSAVKDFYFSPNGTNTPTNYPPGTYRMAYSGGYSMTQLTNVGGIFGHTHQVYPPIANDAGRLFSDDGTFRTYTTVPLGINQKYFTDDPFNIPPDVLTTWLLKRFSTLITTTLPCKIGFRYDEGISPGPHGGQRPFNDLHSGVKDPQYTLWRVYKIGTAPSPKVRVTRPGVNPSDPTVTVANRTTDTTNSASLVNFGTASVGSEVKITFTVYNDSPDLSMKISDVIPQAGFTIVQNFTGKTILPGASDTFILAMDTTTAGERLGNNYLWTSDSKNQFFFFAAIGTVTP